MEIRIDTFPVVGLPHSISIGKGKKLLLLPTSDESVMVSTEDFSQQRELPELLLDLLWCVNVEKQVMLIGSEYGRQVYLIDTDDLSVKRPLRLPCEEEDRIWSQFALLVTPDEQRVVIVSELMAVVLSWEGVILLEQFVLLSDSFVNLENDAITFEDVADEQHLVYRFPGSKQDVLASTAKPEQALPNHFKQEKELNTADQLQFLWSIPPDASVQTEGQALRGEFFLRTQAGDFPCRGWQDMPLIEMSSFLSRALSLIIHPAKYRRMLPFGPYYVALNPIKDGKIVLQFLRSFLPEGLEKLPPLTFRIEDYCQLLLASGQQLLQSCRSRGQGLPQELETLERDIRLLKVALKKEQDK